MSFKSKLARVSAIEKVLMPVFVHGTVSNHNFSTPLDPIIDFNTGTRSQIESFKHSSNYYRVASIAANQIYFTSTMISMSKVFEEGKWDVPENLNLEENSYEVYINPKVIGVSESKNESYEYCHSMPYIKALVSRFDEIKFEYYDENADEKEKILSGFQSRLFQHSLDLLCGYTLLDFRISKGNIQVMETSQPEDDMPDFKEVWNF